MLLETELNLSIQSDHTPMYATGRDAGNFAAGAVAARSILSTNMLLKGYVAYNLANNRIAEALPVLIGSYVTNMLIGFNPLELMPEY